MISKNNNNVDQVQIVSLEQLVPKDHLLRKVDEAVDFNFIYDLVENKYSTETGRPSIDPVTLIKIPIIQYMFGIKSMRQTIKDIEVNVAYRWFLGLGFYDEQLKEEINLDREAHGKKPLKDKETKPEIYDS